MALPKGETDETLLPPRMKTARLALRAHIAVGPFPVTVVRLGIGAHGMGVMEVTWNRDGNGRRETHSARLTPAEIDRLLAAINRSDFWQLPRKAAHIFGPVDGEIASVQVSVPGWNNSVVDFIGDPDTVDLSILVNTITPMIKSRWKDVPA